MLFGETILFYRDNSLKPDDSDRFITHIFPLKHYKHSTHETHITQLHLYTGVFVLLGMCDSERNNSDMRSTHQGLHQNSIINTARGNPSIRVIFRGISPKISLLLMPIWLPVFINALCYGDENCGIGWGKHAGSKYDSQIALIAILWLWRTLNLASPQR